MDVSQLSRLLLMLAVSLFSLDLADCRKFQFLPGEVQDFSVMPNDTSNIFYVFKSQIPVDTTYLMIQLHSQIHNLTLSNSPLFEPTNTKIGTSVGFIHKVDEAIGTQWYLKVNSTQNVADVGMLKLLTAYDPLPGGCNQVFNMEYDPSVLLTYNHYRTFLLFQWANVATVNPLSCESAQMQNNLDYSFYVYYLEAREFGEDKFIDGVKQMLDAISALDNGRKIDDLTNTDTAKPELYVTSEARMGAIYSVVVHRKDTGRSVAYVAGVTYACDFSNDECNADLTVFEYVLVGVMAIAGCFLFGLGHRMFKISQTVFGYIFAFLLVYILMSIPESFNENEKLGIAGVAGVAGGGLWLLLWWCVAFPTASVFVPGLCAGYLISASLYFSPFANISWWNSTENYALGFVCVVMLFTVILMAFPKMLNILSSSLVGSGLMIMAVALPLLSSVRLIFMYSLYRQTKDDYGKLKVFAPIQIQDIVLAATWGTLTIFSVMLQFQMAKGKPDFEHPKLSACNGRRKIQRNTQYVEDDDSNDEENRRLIPQSYHNGFAPPQSLHNGHAPPSYESVQNPQYASNSQTQKNRLR